MRGQIYIPILFVTIILAFVLGGGLLGNYKQKPLAQYSGTITDLPIVPNTVIAEELLSNYGLKIAGKAITPAKISYLYQTIQLLHESNFWNFFEKALPLTANFKNPDSKHPACSGHASGLLHNIDIYGECSSLAYNIFVIAHELSHHVYFNNPDLVNKFYPIFKSRSNKNFLPTPNCDHNGYTDGYSPDECFPDTLATYLVYQHVLPDYSTNPKYADIYSFAKMIFKTEYRIVQ